MVRRFCAGCKIVRTIARLKRSVWVSAQYDRSLVAEKRTSTVSSQGPGKKTSNLLPRTIRSQTVSHCALD